MTGTADKCKPARRFMEEFLLTLHPVHPFTLVQGTRESGTLGWKQIFMSKMIGARNVQRLRFPIGTQSRFKTAFLQTPPLPDAFVCLGVE